MRESATWRCSRAARSSRRSRPAHAHACPQTDAPGCLLFVFRCLQELQRRTEQLEAQAGGSGGDGSQLQQQQPAAGGGDNGQQQQQQTAAARAVAVLTHLMLDMLQALAHPKHDPGAAAADGSPLDAAEPGPDLDEAADAAGAPGAPLADAPGAAPGSRPPPPQQPPLPEAAMCEAGDLLLAYTSSSEGAKLAAKLAAALRLGRRHVAGWGALRGRLPGMLHERATCGAAVRLMMAMQVRACV